MTAAHFDAAIARIARRQQGAFSHEQVLRAGGTQHIIDRRIATGRWFRLDRGVYALAGNPPTWLRQCWAAVLTHENAVISGRAAAALLRFPGFRPAAIHITVPRGADHRSRLARVHQSDLVETTRIDGLPTTTMAQTVVDVARFLDEERLGKLVDELELGRTGTLDMIRARDAALAQSRLPGSGRLRAVLDDRGDGYVPPESELEAMLWKVLRGIRGLPTWLPQVAFPWLTAGAGRVDVVIPAWRAIIEADGRRWHTRVSDFAVDRERDNEAVLRGYRALRFTWHQLMKRRAFVRASIARLGELDTTEIERSGNQRASRGLVA